MAAVAPKRKKKIKSFSPSPPLKRTEKYTNIFKSPSGLNTLQYLDCLRTELGQLISGFHRALLQSITFISRLNALDYIKLRS